MDDIELIDEIVKRAEEHQKQKEKEFAIEELEKIKEEIIEFCKGYLCTPQPEAVAEDINRCVIDNCIKELKGENNE